MMKYLIPLILLFPSLVFAKSDNSKLGRIQALEAEDIVLHERIDAIDSLPVGANPGDILYWDGYLWHLSPAPPVGATRPVTLTLIEGVPTWTEAEAEDVYAIGDPGPAGGIVFYITDGGLHGLEVAPVDQVPAPWGCEDTNIVGADRTAVGAGAPNTADIVSGCAEANTAAKIADAYTLNGYNDWFLPSKDELNLMYQQNDYFGLDQIYWSSSEDGSASAWSQCFGSICDNIVFYSAWKDTVFLVRAVRAF